jgi:ATP-dependent DNA helicase RecG
MGRDFPMSRLLEGDVGSGKTAVAAATAYAVMIAGKKIKKPPSEETAEQKMETKKTDQKESSNVPFQVAYMCPTEILATQHFESFIKYFSYMPIQIALITGSGCKKYPSKVNPKGWTDISRPQLLKWVADGSISVVVGTHALIQKSVVFRNLAYVIIDEQHRFGTSQRARLTKKDSQAEEPQHGQESASSPTPLHAPVPHLLSMTATPIPRTLALTIY